MSIREELILKVLAKEDSVTELAQQYGIGRETIYKWLSHYDGARVMTSQPAVTAA